MTESILSTPEGHTIKLGDKEYKLSPLNLNVMMAIEEEFNCSFSEFGKLLQSGEIKEVTSTAKVLLILLKENHPEVSLAEIGKVITLDNFEVFGDAIGQTLMGAKYIEFKTTALAKKKRVRK